MIRTLPDMVFPPQELLAAGTRAYSVAPGASPWTYTAQTRQAMHVTGGSVSLISYTRGPLTLGLGVLLGGQLIELNPGDSVRIGYLTVPSITIIPR